MKEFLSDMMAKYMDVMFPLFWIAVAFAGIALLFIIIRAITKAKLDVIITLSQWVVIVFAIIFYAAQIMGYVFDMSPGLNFGDAKKFEINMIEFWIIGSALLGSAIVIKLLKSIGASNRNSQAA